MSVALLGEELRSIEGAEGAAPVIERLARGDRDARSEILAARIARGPTNEGEVEFGPLVEVGERIRRPDFRIREHSSADWTYIEVTAPDDSDESNQLRGLLARLTAALADLQGPFHLEAILRRVPSEAEEASLVVTLRRLSESSEPIRVDLDSGLGLVLAQTTELGVVRLDDHGEPPTTRIGLVNSVVIDGVPVRTLALRVTYNDTRAARFIDEEAKQLPSDAPTIIMVDFGEVISGRGVWEALIHRRFQPAVHTRIGAAILFTSGVLPLDDRLETRIAARSIVNPHARMPAPAWLMTNLGSWPEALLEPSEAM